MIPRLHKRNIRHLHQLHCTARSTTPRSSLWRSQTSLVQTSRLSGLARDSSSASTHISSSDTISRNVTPALQSSRSFATAVTEPDGPENMSAHFQTHSLPTTNALEASPPSIIIMKEAFEAEAQHVRRFNGMGGYQDEMISNLDACLSSGMFERAESLFARLVPMYPRDSPELNELYRRCLERMVSYMLYYRQHTLIPYIQRWFEHKEAQGMMPNASSYALMLKMSLQMLTGFRRERTARRYWDRAKDAELDEQTLASGILTSSDLVLLTEVCKPDFNAPEVEGIAKDMKQKEQILNEGVQSAVPEAMATHQKGLGYKALKSSMSLFDNNEKIQFPSHLDCSEEDKQSIYARLRQRKLENDSITSAIQRWRQERADMKSRTGGTSQSSLGSHLATWHEDLVMEIEAELSLIEELEMKPINKFSPEDQDRLEYAPYLRMISSETLAAITMLSALNALATMGVDRGIKLSTFVTSIGLAVYEEYTCNKLRMSDKLYGKDSAKEKILHALLRPKDRMTNRKYIEKTTSRFADTQTAYEWAPSVDAKVGSILTSLLFNCAMIPIPMVENENTDEKTITMQPAFRRVYQLERGNRIGKVLVHESMVEILKKDPPAALLAKHLPMVAPPRPWDNVFSGGFMEHKSCMMRVKRGEQNQIDYLKATMEQGRMNRVFQGLSVLGKTGWRINKGVFDVLLEIWNSGESLASLAPANPNIKYPTKPDTDDPELNRKYSFELRTAENQKMAFHSQRCFQNFQIEIARTYLNETFYLPHNCDFRGRAYPMVPYFNQMCADNCRGLLLFSEGRKLGKNGLYWLKVHLANVYGYDRASLSEREKFTMEHLDDITDSADKGLHGRRWWLESEDPFQCLAACIELTNALRCENPMDFVSHLPIQQDGSCNGLQHYAALGGDLIGAQQVNLVPSDRPSDVYTAVAEWVKKSITEDSDRGDPIGKLLDGKVTRKIVKQTVMTNVYGVTFLGAIRQVRKQLDDYYPELEKSQSAGKCATFVTRKIFQALGHMFSGAHDIQYWFGDCASRITASFSPEQVEHVAALNRQPLPSNVNSNVKKAEMKRLLKLRRPDSHFKTPIIWTTPLNLPVIQPYREPMTRIITTTLQTVSIREPRSSDRVNRRKQLQAFPPNFIHSLDATHMLMSASKCDELGLQFSAVHDSFWTHACDIDTMGRVLRDAFVTMHSENLISRLYEEFKRRYGDHIYLGKIRYNTTAGQAIHAYRLERKGLTQVEELELEARRLRLLKSEDPEEVKEGKQMVTAATILEAHTAADAKADLVTTKSHGVTFMGDATAKESLIKQAEEGAITPDLGEPEDDMQSLLDSGDILSTMDDDIKRQNEQELDEEMEFDIEEELELEKEKKEMFIKTGETFQAQPPGPKKKGRKPKNPKPPVPEAPETEESKERRAKLAELKHKNKTVWAWLPLTFLPVPTKGEFDVSRLRDSQYFFS